MKRLFNKRSFRNFCLFMVLIFTNSLIAPVAVLGGDLPAGPDVKIGDPTISTVDKTMNINAGSHDKTWIDWKGGFNIGASNTVNNIGPSAAAAMLHNDVSGSISSIRGILNGNCNVFLLNANGIIFSSTARINVGGLIASTLMMSQDDFLSGNYIFKSGALENPGFIINEGTINAFGKAGVSMLGGAIKNIGTIKADLGTVNLISGREVTLNVAGDGSIQAAMTKEVLNNVYDQDGNKVTVGVENLGAITADGGEIRMETGAVQDVFDTLINQEGIVRAGSMVEKDGRIVLISGSEGIIQNTGTMTASAIEDGADGGEIGMRGDMVGQFGAVHADAMGEGDGGNITIYANEVVALSSGSLTTANAAEYGDGGEIIVYSPETALFWDGARIEAKGGSISGDGGFVEVSGKERVYIRGMVDASATNGVAGTFLIDPTDINIVDTGTVTADLVNPGAGDPRLFTTNANTNEITDDDIETLLNGGTSVTLDTSNHIGGPFGGTGNIVQAADAQINFTGGGGAETLTLIAENDIELNGGIASAGAALNVVLTATADVEINAAITTNGGTFDSTGVNFDNNVTGAGTITTAGGAVTINHTGAITIDETISSAAGNVDIDSTAAGDITIDNSGISTTLGTVNINNANGAIKGILASDGTADVSTEGGTLDLTADSIHDSAAAALDIDTSTGAVTLTGNAVGGDLEVDYVSSATNAVTLTVTHNGAGNVIYDSLSTGVLTVAASSLSNGNLEVHNDAGISVTGLLNTSVGANDNLTLEALTGNIALGNVDNILTAGTGAVIVTATAGNITVADATTAVEIVTAGSVSLTGGAIGATHKLDLNGATALTITDLDGDANHIQIRERNTSTIASTTIVVPTATSGNIDIEYVSANVVDINNGHVLNNVDLSNATTSSFTYTATAGDITATSVDTGTNNTTITATNGNIENVTGNSIVANVLTLTTSTASKTIGTVTGTDPLVSSPLLINAETLKATTAQGHIIIKDTAGGIDIDAITTAGGDATRVILEAVYGAITATDQDDIDITTWAANLITSVDPSDATNYGDAIGTLAQPIRTNVTVLSATAEDGGVYINQPSNDIILGNITARSEGRFPYKNEEGNIVLDAYGNRSGYDIKIDAGAAIYLGGSSVIGGLIAAPDVITVTAGDEISDSHDGDDFVAITLTLDAGGDALLGIGIGQDGNPIETTVETINAECDTQGIYITESQSATIGTITSAGASNDVEIIANTGSLLLGDITAAGATVTVESKQGSITDNNVGVANVTATAAVLSGKTGIGASDDDIETAVGTLSVTTDTVDNGGIYITESDALTSIVVETNTSIVEIHYDPGVARTLNFDSGEDLSLSTADTGVTTFSFENTGGLIDLEGIGINTGSGVVTLTASTAITQTSGALSANTATLTAGTFIGASGTEIATTVATLTAAASDGGVYISEADAIDLTASAAGTTKDVVVTNAGAANMTINAVTATRAVNLTAAGSLLDGNAATNNISGTATTLVASAGSIGTLGNPIESTVAGTIDTTSTTGVFLTNTGAVSQFDASASADGDIAFINTGTAVLGVISAVGNAVTLTVSDDITDLADATTDITGATLVVDAKTFGTTGNPIETDVTTITSIETTNGGIFFADLAGPITITEVIAGGAGSDVEISSVGNITLHAITATGDNVILATTGGNITDANDAAVNITATTLDISASGSVDGLELAVSQITSDVAGGIAAVNTGPISITAASLQGNTSPVTLEADNITILDEGDDLITMGAGGSLSLTANYGDIVFLDANDKIVTVDAGTITLSATYNGTPPNEDIDNVFPGRIVVGDLTSGSGAIQLTAYSDVTIGELTTTGTVTITSNNGLILDGNGDTNNITAGTVNLTAQMHTLAAALLDRENAIAAYEASVAEANSAESQKNLWTVQYTDTTAIASTAESVKTSAQSTYNTAESDKNAQETSLATYEGIMNGYNSTRTIAQVVKDGASFVAGAAQAIPFSGDAGADAVFAGIDLVFSIADAVANAYETNVLSPQEDVVQEAQDTFSVADANLYSATNDFNNATSTAAAANNSLDIATADFDAAEIARDHAQAIREQAVTSYNATNAIGTSGNIVRQGVEGTAGQLEIDAAVVNVTTTGTTATATAAANLVDAITVTLDTTGPVTITNANDEGLATVDLQTDENISYTQTGGQDVQIAQLFSSDLVSGTITLVADGEIYGQTYNGTADIEAATITLTSTSGGIGQTTVLEVNATTALNVTTTTGNGNIRIEDVTGDLPLGAVNAGSGTVVLTSAGVIDDATTDTTADITGNIVDLNAATGIGSGKELELAGVDTITADNATSGNIDIDNVADAAVTITSMTTKSVGDINYGQTGGQTLGITLAQVVDGDIAIANNAAVNVVDINGDIDDGVVSLTATGGALTSTNSDDAVLSHTLMVPIASTVGGDGAADNVVDALWFDVDVTDLNITAAGATYLDEKDDINLADVALTGELGVDAVGTLTVTKATSDAQVFLNTTGDIVDGGETDTDVDCTGLRMTAVSGIGSAGAIETAVSTLAATTTTGHIYIDNTGALDINAINTVNGVTITNGAGNYNIAITASSPNEINVAVTNSSGGNIELSAEGATTADDLTLNANVTATGGTGNIDLYAGDSVIQAAGITVSAASTGTVKVYAGEDWADTTVDADGTSTGAIEMNNTALINANTGVMTLIAAGDITLGGLLTTNATGTAVTITSTAGGIVDAGDTYTDIDANEVNAVVTIDAVTGVGDGNALETEVATIDIDNLPVTGADATGNIQIVELAAGGGLIVQKAVQGDVGVEATNSGNVSVITNDGVLTISGTVTARDGGTITLTSAATVDNGGADIEINAVVLSDVGLKDQGVGVVNAGNITVTSGDDVVFGTAAGVFRIEEDILDATNGTTTVVQAGTVQINADGNIRERTDGSINDAAAEIIAETIDLNGGIDGAGIIGQSADASAGTISGALEVDSGTATVDASTVGAINLTETNGNMTIGLIDSTGDAAITLTTSAGSIEESADAATLNIDGGAVVLSTTGGGIGTTSTIDIETTTLTSTSDNANIDLSEVDSDSDDLDIVSVNAGTGSVTLASVAGAIDDDALGAIDITAVSVDLDAVLGIGHTNHIDIAASTITADNTTSGNVDIDSILATAVSATSLTTGIGAIDFEQSGGGAVSFGVVSTTNGAIDLEQQGDANLTVTTSVTAGGSNNIILHTTGASGNIVLTGTTTAIDDQIEITSIGSINGAGLVTAQTVDLNAVDGIGSTTSLELAATSIDADTTGLGAASIDIDNTLAAGDVTLDSFQTAGTNANIVFDQTGGASLIVTSAITSDGDIDVSIDSGSLTATVITVGTHGNILLDTTTSGDVTIGMLTAIDDDVTISSVGDIDDNGDDVAGDDIDADTVSLTAATGIGATSNLEIENVTTLSADTTTGNIDIDNASDAAVTVTTMTTTDGNIDYDQTGAYGLALGTVSADTTNDIITITAAGAITPSADNTAAEVTGYDINLTTTANGIGTSGTGALDVNATHELDADTTADDAAILIDDITGDLPIGVIDADSGAVTLTSVGGVTDVDAAAGLDIGGGTVTIDAVTGVGSANALETEVATIDIDNAPGTGSTDVTANIQIIELTAGGGLTVQKAVQGDRGVEAKNSGNIDISTQNGTLTVSGAVTARDGGTITLDVEDSGAGNTDVIINAAVTSSVGLKDVGVDEVYSGDITITADHDINVNSKISTANANTSYTANGDIALTTDTGQDGSVYLAAEIETLGTGTISITADENVNFDAAGGLLDTTETSSTLADITVTARDGNIVESNNDTGAPDLDIQARTITLNAENGAIGQGAGGDIDIDSVVSVSADTSTGGGNITLNERSGNLPVALIDAGTGDVTLTSASGITDADADAAVDIIAAALYLEAGGSVGADGSNQELDTQVATIDDRSGTKNVNGSIYIIESDGVTLGSINGLSTDTGSITISAGGIMTATDVNASGTGSDVTLSTTAGGMVLTSVLADDDITATADAGDITLDVVGDAGTDDITITATTGSINEVGAGDAAVDITGDVLTLTAQDEIGGAGELDIETTVTSLTAESTSAGLIYITETDTITLTSVTTTDGLINIASGGAMTVTLVTAGGDTGSNDDVTLTTTVGDIIMSGDITALNDEVTLISAANITDTTDGTTDISAANLDITASSGTVGAIGANNELDTDVDTLTIAAQGNTYVLEENAITLTSIVTTNGLIDIEAAGTITTTIVTAGGVNGVALYASAGNIFDTAGGLITAGANSSLKASGIIGTAVTPSYNPVDVNIDGDLWVLAGAERDGVSVILDGYVNSSAETERVEIYEPSPPGLVMLDNRLMGGGNYGSGSAYGSILSRGYGETLIVRTDMFSLFYDRAVRPWGHKISTPWLPFEGYMVDNDFLNSPIGFIDISPLDLKTLPLEKFQSRHYYIIRQK